MKTIFLSLLSVGGFLLASCEHEAPPPVTTTTSVETTRVTRPVAVMPPPGATVQETRTVQY